MPLSELPAALAGADLVVSCTGAVGHVLSADLLVRRGRRPGPARPLVVLDLALPRDVEPGRPRRARRHRGRPRERWPTCWPTTEHAADVEAAREIVADEVAAFLGWQRAASVAPTVVALRAMADDVVQAELARLAGRLPDLDPRARAEIEQTVRRVVDKLLHAPTVRVKELAEEPGGQSYADALRELFDLDPAAVEAVTRADVAELPRRRTVRHDRRSGSAPGAARWPSRRRSWSPTRSRRAPVVRSSSSRSRRTATLSREALAQIGGTGVFVAALRDALLAGDVDLAVHSLKDLPTAAPDGLAARRRARRARTRATCWSPATG